VTTEDKELPFFDGTGPVAHDTFAGRDDLRKLFASLTWDRKTKKRQDYILVLEGKTSFGKSSMLNWCLGEVKNKAPNGEVIISTLRLSSDPGSEETIKENFYNYLFNETYRAVSKSLQEREWAWKLVQAKWHGKKFIRKISEYEFGGYNPLKGAKFKQLNSKAYFELIKQLNRGAKVKPKAYAIIIDNVSHNEKGPQLCAELLMDLREHSESNAWPADFPNVVLVLLPLPGWSNAKTGADKTLNEIGVRRRIEKIDGGRYEQLDAFSQMEIKDFVQRRCNDTGWQYDEKTFIPALFHMSGGIPLLMQSIGVGACRSCIARNSSHLTSKDVISAVRMAAVDNYVIEILNNALGFKPQDYLVSKEDRKVLPLFYRSHPIEDHDWGRTIPQILKGMTKNEWKKEVLAPTVRSLEIENSFEKLWTAFLDHGILVYEDGKYRFHAEVIRRYLNSYDPQ